MGKLPDEENLPLLELDAQKEVEQPHSSQERTSEDAAILTTTHQYILLVVLLALHGCVLCSDSFLYPFFGTEAKRKGLADKQIGVVYSSYEIVRCLTAPLYGMLITVMKPRLMCFVGALSSGLGVILFGLIYYAPSNWFFFLCVVTRIVTGNGSVMFTVAMTSGLMKVTKFKSTTIIASMEGSLAVAFICGPVLGTGLHELGGYTLCFVVMGLLTALLSFLVLPTMPKIYDSSSGSSSSGCSRTEFKQFIKILSIPGVFLTGFLTMTMSKFAYNIITSFAAEWMYEEFGDNEVYVAVLYVTAAISYLAGCSLFSYILSKGYVWSSLIATMPFNCILTLLFTPYVLRIFMSAVSYKWWYTVVIWGVANVTLALPLIAPYEASLHLASANGYDKNSLKLHGLLAGVINLGLNFGATLSPMISGTITEKLGFEWNTYLSASIYLILGFLHILYLLLMKCLDKPLRRPSEEQYADSSTQK